MNTEPRYRLDTLEYFTHNEWGIIDRIGEPFGCGYYEFYRVPSETMGYRQTFFLKEKHVVVARLNELNRRWEQYMKTGTWPERATE